jgi:hypothetical protein
LTGLTAIDGGVKPRLIAPYQHRLEASIPSRRDCAARNGIAQSGARHWPPPSLVVGDARRVADSGADTAVDDQSMTRHERGVVGGEEQHALCDLDRLCHPAERMQTMHGLANCLAMPEGAGDQRSIDDSGAYAVHAHAGGRELEKIYAGPLISADKLATAGALAISPKAKVKMVEDSGSKSFWAS